jgi:16S rRNA (guanine966-N2)-methyltransferase
MRVTGGVLRGREIRVPKGQKVRPTQDRVRQALFSSLAARIPGCRFLDLFAGSGAVGLDAWSRDAAAVCWVEEDARVFEVLSRNVAALCVPEPNRVSRLVRSDALRFLEHGASGEGYDIVYADPPYDPDNRRDWVSRLLGALAASGALAEGGLAVIEQSVAEPAAAAGGWVLAAQKVYGGSRLSFFRRYTAGIGNRGSGVGRVEGETWGDISGDV